MKNTTHNINLFKNIFEASGEGIIVVNEDGLILIANPACENIFGYDLGGLIGKNIEILIPERFKERYKNYIKNQIPPPQRETNTWGIKKDGSRVHLILSLSSTVIEDKKSTIAFFRDATQHKNDLKIIKKTNAKLIESNRKFNALINNQKGIFFRSKNNRNYDINYISEGCFEITGYPLADFKNNKASLGQLILEEDRNHVWDSIQNSIREKKQYDVKYRIKHKDNSIKYVWEKGKAILNDLNEEVLDGFISDITALKKTELQLRANEAKTKALLEAIPDMMLIQDRNGVYLDWYANSPEKMSISPEKFMGLNMEEILSPNVYQKIKTSHHDAITSGNMQLAEYSIKTDKGIQHYEARVVLLNQHKLLTIIRDISEKKSTDAQLDIKNNALASTINSIVIADAQQPHTPIIYCNGAFEKMTGYTLNELLEGNCEFLLNLDREQKEFGIIKNAIVNGKTCEVRIRNYRKNGSMFWNDIVITPVHNEENILTHFIGVQNDVTHKVKEDSLKDKTKKILESIVQNHPLKTIGNKIVNTLEGYFKEGLVSILLLDSDTKKLQKLVAPRLSKTFMSAVEGAAIGSNSKPFGYAVHSGEEIIISNIQKSSIWENFKNVAIESDLEAFWSFPIMSSTKEVLGTINLYSRVAKKPLPEEKEIIRNMTHLMSIAIENHSNTITIEQNKLDLETYTQQLEEKVHERTQEVMATVQKLVETNLNLEDQIITTKQAERDAKTSKSIASEIAKNFPNGFIAVISKELKILFAEGDALKQLGIKHLFQEGMTIDDISIFSEQRIARIKENVKKTLSGRYLSFEAKFKDRYFNVNTAPLLDENNEIHNALHVYSDISQQKEIEFAILNALEKEQELNELKSRFVSMASHEFRTPLSAILTSAILIGKLNDPGNELKRERYVGQIERNVTNLTVILNDFLSLSKLEEGKVTPIPEWFDLISFANSLVLESTIGLKKDQTISLNTAEDELLMQLDIKLLTHILNNLLSNASKYSSEEAHIEFNISQRRNNVILEIADQGIGIPDEEQRHVFGRFFRAKNAVNIEGTGLGLNIVKHYTELMGGTIFFKSKINKGSTFRISFPIATKSN